MSLDRRISELTGAVQSSRDGIDDATRFKAIKAAQGLLAALSSPAETVIQDVVLNSVLLMALRMGVQLGAFTTLKDNQNLATTTQQIADKSGASVVLVALINLELVGR
ncbi:hypothetical protein AbraIFM66950_002370 [Aspergillus brasiliensis]|nr:hypothetical protein AbraIFM66950_002370 [Aspergillus brasiliensis]